MMFTALERLVELKLIPQEAARTTPADDDLPAAWPSKGEIIFDHAVLRYRPELPPALKDLHITIPGGSHVGVVGRTGAGKSSIMALLFRLCEVSSGSIKIDGHCIASLGLRRLRSAINIIPQDPMYVRAPPPSSHYYHLPSSKQNQMIANHTAISSRDPVSRACVVSLPLTLHTDMGRLLLLPGASSCFDSEDCWRARSARTSTLSSNIQTVRLALRSIESWSGLV